MSKLVQRYGFIPLDPRYTEHKALITNGMKGALIGEHKFTVLQPCPKCKLMLSKDYFDDLRCLCEGSDEGMYEHEYIVPWDLAKEIYQDFAAIALKEKSKDDED